MKKLLTSLLIVASMSVVTNTAYATTYTESEFETNSYQQNIIDATKYTMSLSANDFKSYPQAQIESQDLSLAMQTEMAFVQGNLALAGDGYYLLAEKYQDPRFILKSLYCYQTIGTQAALVKFNQLVILLEKIAPNSNQAMLYAIPNSLSQGDISLAKTKLNKLMKANPQNQRDILLVLATLLSSKNYILDKASVLEFGNYVIDKYGDYPEGLLVASITDSLAALPSAHNPQAQKNASSLLGVMNQIRKSYPSWELPVYWNAGILVNENESDLLYKFITQDINNRPNPSMGIENLYVAVLLKLGKTQEADDYIESSQAYKAGDANALINEAIVEYKKGNYKYVLSYLKQALDAGYNLDDTVQFALGAINLNLGNNQQARAYFESALTNNPNLLPVAGIGVIQSYIIENNLVAADKYIENMAKLSGNTDKAQVVITRMAIFNDMKQYKYSYKIGQSLASKYMSNSKFVYQYASSAALSGNTNKAISLYKIYIKMEPQDAVGYNDYAYLLTSSNSNDYKYAVSLAQKAYEISPTDPAVLDTLGWAYYKDKQYNQAVTYLSKAYSITFNDEIGTHLKAALIAIGDKKGADNVSFAESKNVTSITPKQQLADQSMLMLLYYQFGADVSADTK